MPAFTRLQKIDTFLLQRRDDRPVRPDDMQEDSQLVYVLLPAVAYKMAQVTNQAEENMVVRTVIDLAKVLKSRGMDRGVMIDQVAERTKLNRLLIKTILKRYENSLDIETGEENGELREEFYYLIYDPMTQYAFPEMIPAEQYEKITCFEAIQPSAIDVRGGQGKLRFQTSMSGSGWRSVWVLPTGEQELTYPQDPPVSRALERKYQRKGELTYLGIAEPVGLICTCFLSKDDLSTIHIMNPIGEGTMDQLYENIKMVMDGEREKNEELFRFLDRMDRQRRDILDQLNTFQEKQDAMKRELQLMYPDIEKYPKVWKHMTSLESRCKEYHEMQENSGMEQLISVEQDIVNDFHGAMEEIFTFSLNKNYPKEQAEQFNRLLEHLNGRRDYREFFIGLADQIGLADLSETREFFESREGKINLSVLKNIVLNIRTDKKFKKSLPELVVAHIMEAAVWEGHPFRELIARCPRILFIVKWSLKRRNDIKHGSETNLDILGGREVPQFRALAEAALDILLVHRASEEDISQEKLEYDLRQAAAIKAKEQLQNYPALRKLVERPAHRACSRFFYKDGEYFSECSNLLSEIFDQLLSEHSNRTQRKQAAEWFSGCAETDDQMMHQLFQQYGCDYESTDRPATAKIRWFIDNGREMKNLSLKCKLYLSFVLLDRERPEVLRQLLERAPQIPQLTDQVCEKRGHNELTVFSDSPDQYQSFHSQMLENCDGFCDVISAIGGL